MAGLDFTAKLKEALEVLAGMRGNGDDQAVRRRDLSVVGTAAAEAKAGLTALIGTVKRNAATAEQLYAEQQAQITAADAVMADLTMQVEGVVQTVATYDDTLTALDGEVTGNASAITSLGARVTQTENDIVSVSGSLTTLQSDVGDVQASVTQQAGTIATLQGAASAGYLIKAQAGGEVSLLELVAADGSAGSVSVAKLAADAILLDGSVTIRSLGLNDADNLLSDGGWWAGDLDGYVLNLGASGLGEVSLVTDTADRQTGAHALRLRKDLANMGDAISILTPGTGRLAPVVAGDPYWMECVAKSGGEETTGGFWAYIRWFDVDKAHLSDTTIIADGVLTGVYESFTLTDVAPAGAVYAGIAAFNNSNQTEAQDFFVDRFVLKRLPRGSLSPEMIGLSGDVYLSSWQSVDDVTMINGGSIYAQSVTASRITVDEYLDINSVEAGFRMGKLSTADYATDGAYFGRTDDGAGGLGFGFFVGRTDNGENQFIRCTQQDGLELQNAKFIITAGTGAGGTVFGSQTINLDPSSEVLSFTMVAGGKGGEGGYGRTYDSREGSYTFHPPVPPGNGGNTVVQLRDGTTVIQQWTAAGATGNTGSRPGQSIGQASGAGNGGAGGVNHFQYSGSWVPKGGKAGQVISVSGLDISALANPNLVVTIGGGGARGYPSDGSSSGAAVVGNGGLFSYSVSGFAQFEARPISLRASYHGTMGFSGGTYNLPQFGNKTRGLWHISSVPSGFAAQVGDGHSVVCHVNGGSITFVSQWRPTYYSPSGGTLRYSFWPMDT